MEFALEAEFLKLLAHPIRLSLIDALSRKPAIVKELQERLSLPQAVVSQHLSLLRGRGIVEAARNGNTTAYSLVHPLSKKIVKVLADARKVKA